MALLVRRSTIPEIWGISKQTRMEWLIWKSVLTWPLCLGGLAPCWVVRSSYAPAKMTFEPTLGAGLESP